MVKGRHSIKMGYEFLAIRTEVLDINPLYGQLTYSGQYSKPTAAQCGCTPATDANSVNAYDLADFYFGLPSAIAQGNDLVTNLRQHVNSLYVQDDWRVTPKLTLNLGLRWEYATPVWERDNLWSNFNPATNTLVRATNGSIYDRALVNPDYKDFGPRLGFAYSVMPKTVIRAGYGISYDFFNRTGSAGEGHQRSAGHLRDDQPGRPTSPGISHRAKRLHHRHRQQLQPDQFQQPLHSRPIPAGRMIQSWVFSIQREITRTPCLRWPTTAITACGCRSSATGTRPLRTCPAADARACQARVPDPSFGPITWVDPAGNNNYNGLSVRLEHRFGHGLYFLNSFTWSHAMGDSEQVLEAFTGYQAANPQNIYNLHNEFGPSHVRCQAAQRDQRGL